ncbi:Chromatin modification-related protein EAF3, partial [Phytophthora megakarya]
NRAAPMTVKVGDTVLAYHGLMIYDAKVQKVDNGQGVQEKPGDGGNPTASTQYYLHYQGWAKKWDEWVRHDRVLEDTTANRALQKKAKEDVATAKKEKRLSKKKKISSAGVDAPSARKSPFKRLKRSVESEYEEFPAPNDSNFEDSANAKQINIQMPFSLKKQLVEDWKHVTHAPHKLVPLPRKPNVSQIIKTYLEFKKSKVHDGEASEEKEFKNIEGIMEGVQSYFDRALSSILLYRMERRQYQEMRKKHSEEVPLSQIYGAEHLIRLFVRLPVLLASSNIAPRELHQLQARLNDFLKYIQKNSAAWFVTEYEVASEKYVEQTTATN